MNENAAKIFNDMKEEYDELHDLWYSWLFSRLHFLIAQNAITPHNPKKVLDIGCGTGFQSFLFASSGSEVTGIDIASELIEKAESKKQSFTPSSHLQLFEPHFPFVEEYNQRIAQVMSGVLDPSVYQAPKFQLGDACKLEFSDASFDHVNCCGSTLNFIENYKTALSEISRVLKPNGTFSIEVDARWNMDILWPVIDNLLFGALKFEMRLKESFANLMQPVNKHIKIDYPFGEPENPIMMNIWLFTKTGLKNDLLRAGLLTDKTFSIHSFTNLIPSTFLDTPNPGPLLKRLFYILSALDEAPVLHNFPGCSLVLFGHKKT